MACMQAGLLLIRYKFHNISTEMSKTEKNKQIKEFTLADAV